MRKPSELPPFSELARLTQWLDAKYARHNEIEDADASKLLHTLWRAAHRSRAASEPGEVARLAEELKRSLTFADPRTSIWYHERIDHLASMATSPASEAQAEWVMVPREPTPDMLAAIPWPTSVAPRFGVECYRAMLASAPQPAASPVVADAADAAEPIDMVLHCPACGRQHIDGVETDVVQALSGLDTLIEVDRVVWNNPPHRSHLCHDCGHVWRPADVPTNGVAEVKTKGREDSDITNARYVDPDPPGSFTPDSLLIRMHLANGTEIVGTNKIIPTCQVLSTVLGVEVVAGAAKEMAISLYRSCGLLKPTVKANHGNEIGASEDVLVFAIEVEKMLCKKLGRSWSAGGISIESLIDELANRKQGS